MTSDILGDMKVVKMLDFSSTILETVQATRIAELKLSAAFRTFIVLELSVRWYTVVYIPDVYI